MKDAPTVTNPAGRSHGHHDLQFIIPILIRATPVSAARGSSTTANSFRATFNGTNQSSKVEKLLSRAIIKTIDNAGVNSSLANEFAPFL
jgi:hypothetical protein